MPPKPNSDFLLALPIKALKLKMKIKAKVVKKKMMMKVAAAALPNEGKVVPTVVGFVRELATVRTYFLASASC